MSTLCMKQRYLLHTFFQKSTWIFAEKYKYIINFPVTNIKNENNCFVLKNYTVPNNEFGRKTSKLLKLELDWYTSIAFCPRVNVNHLRLCKSEKLHYFPLILCFCPHRHTQTPKVSLSSVDSVPGSHPTGLGQVIGKSNIYLTLLRWCSNVKQVPHASDLDHRRGRAACPGRCQPRAGLPLAVVRSKPRTEDMRNWARAVLFFSFSLVSKPLAFSSS